MANKQKNNAASIFLSFFLKAIVIILGLVILAMSVYLVKQLISNKNMKTEKESDESVFVDDQKDDLMVSSAGEAEKEKVLFEKDDDKQDGSGTVEIGFEDSIVVLNATETAGLAAAWKEKLEEAGFKNVQTGNYLNGYLDSSKIVVAKEGSGGNLKNFLPNAKMESLSPDEIAMDASPGDAKAVLIIGNSDIITSE